MSQLELPFLETNRICLHQIFETLEQEFDLKKNSQQVFVDLGAGNGQVIIFSALNYGLKSFGIEIDLTLVEEAKRSIKLLKKLNKNNKEFLRKIKIIQGDFYKQNLGNYDFIYIYSLPTMQKFLRHIFQTVKNGTVIISHMYPFKDFKECLELV
ncbi:MAG: class I SAM-dependent methyltransferase, partial [Candidatus Lokiarchaeota archaeon]|nr:class I SAM-dependent methyltransferase [Candidatus Lokiarchaeota archaeon]